MKTGVLGAAIVVAALAVTPAMAKGPGKYGVKGTNGGDKSEYSGNATLTKTGENTWRLVSVIGSDKFEGYGIGDDDIIAVTYAGGGSTAVALYVAQADGSYSGVWAFKGDTKVSIETLTPK
ncbi:hypothetical protein [Aquabacter cavernae]|uniref:hypothetical protein n=1 Tax=Aquabacter cavernae TaxID=2496029 RepID=UPI000F8E3274|nr:hypothetical protein [Aquabacter cavernae]